MASSILIKRSSTGSSVPSSLQAGELAINLVDKKLYSSTGSTVFVLGEHALANTNAFIKAQLANTNSYIATKVNTTTFNSALANTNTYIATKLATTTAATTYQTIAIERLALANTNAFIKAQLANTNSWIATKVNTTTFNSALANTNTYIATKASTADPTTSGLLAHTGRATISTNLDVSGNTTLGAAGKTISTTGVLAHTGRATISTNLTVSGNTVIGKLVANGTIGNSGEVLKSNGSSVYWGTGTQQNLTCDITSVGAATTLATVNSNVGAFGGTTAIPVITVNAKGLVTAVTTSAVVAPAGTLSGSSLASGVTASSLTSLGTIATLSAGTISASGLVAAAGRLTVGTNLSVSGNTTINGNLTVAGSLTYIDSTTISLGDNMIKVANNNVADTIDMGIYQKYVSSGAKYTGLIRDASDGVYKLFTGLTTEPNQTIDFSAYTMAQLDAVIDGGTY